MDPSLVLNLGLGEGTERILVLMVSRASEVLEGRSTSVTVSFKGWSTKIVDLSPSPPPQLKVHFDEPPKSSFDDPRPPVLLSWPSNSSDKQSTVLPLFLGSQYSMSELKSPIPNRERSIDDGLFSSLFGHDSTGTADTGPGGSGG